MRTIIVTSDSGAKIKKEVPDSASISFDGLTYCFQFYYNERTHCIAISNTVGCDDFHGKGHNWWFAMHDCFRKIQNEFSK